ncbi:DUF4123 domain-containing protein [Photorhabdus asymbiotica]|uniref:DUF4123 domain-containing protein n=1 Tax=Photorhabdus asymbiotica TaxID=291112 RepID=UPI003DA71D87
MEKVNYYAVIDGALMHDLYDMLEQLNPIASSLYTNISNKEEQINSPHLVELTQPVKVWLSRKKDPWGLYLLSTYPFEKLRQHLRKYLQVFIPTEKKPVFFRYYDPRVFWIFIDILSHDELNRFLSPIKKVISYHHGIYRESTPFEYNSEESFQNKDKFFKITPEQYQIFNDKHYEQYIVALTHHMLAYWCDIFLSEKNVPDDIFYALENKNPNEKFEDISEFLMIFPDEYYIINKAAIDRINSKVYYIYHSSLHEKYREINNFVVDIYAFCQQNNIIDDVSIKTLMKLCIIKEILSANDIPEGWLHHLMNKDEPGFYNVKIVSELNKRNII